MAMSMDAGMSKSGRKRHQRAEENQRAKITALIFREGLRPMEANRLRPMEANKERLDEATAGSLSHMYETYTSLAEDGQLFKKTIRYGNGVKLVAGAFMKIHYRVFSFDSSGHRTEKPFDSSLEREDLEDDNFPNRTVAVPRDYRLMAGEVIGVLDIGVATMEVGEIANFVAVGNYAYGSFGLPGILGPNEPVFVQVEVLEGQEPTIVRQILKGALEDKSLASLDDIFEAVKEFRARGNQDFNNKRWQDAIRNYKLGVLWVDTQTMYPADVQRFTSMHYGLLNNMAACYIQLRKYKKAIETCETAINVPDKPEDLVGEYPAKLYYRLAHAQYELEMFEESMVSIKKAKGYEPSNVEITRLYEKLARMAVRNMHETAHMWKKIAMAYMNPRKGF